MMTTRRRSLIAVAMLASIAAAAPAQNVELELRAVAREMWNQAEKATELFDDDRPICVFPLISPATGYKPPRTSEASDVFWDRVLDPTAPAPFRKRIKWGRPLAAELENRGVHTSAYTSPFHRATLMGSVANAGYVISGTLEFLKDELKIVLYGCIPGQLDKQQGFFEREYTIPKSLGARDPFVRDLFNKSRNRTRAGFEVGYGKTPANPWPGEAKELLAYVLAHRLHSYKRFAARKAGSGFNRVALMLPLRRASDRELTGLSKHLESAFNSAYAADAISCDALDKMMQQLGDDDLAAFEFENLPPYLFDRLKSVPQVGGRKILGSTRSTYVINGNKLTVSLYFQSAQKGENEWVDPQVFTVEHDELIAAIKALDGKPDPYGLSTRELDTHKAINRLLARAAEEVVRDVGKDLFEGTKLQIERPELPAMSAAYTYVEIIKGSLQEEHRRLLNQAQADPEKWPDPGAILSARVGFNLHGRPFGSFVDARQWFKELLAVTATENSSQLQAKLQTTLNRKVRGYLRKEGVKAKVDGGSSGKKARRRRGLFEPGDPSPVSEREKDAEPIDFALVPTVHDDGAQSVVVQILVEDEMSGEEVAASSEYRLNKSYINRSLKQFVTPDQVKGWKPEGDLARLWNGIDRRALYLIYSKRN